MSEREKQTAQAAPRSRIKLQRGSSVFGKNRCEQIGVVAFITGFKRFI